MPARTTTKTQVVAKTAPTSTTSPAQKATKAVAETPKVVKPVLNKTVTPSSVAVETASVAPSVAESTATESVAPSDTVTVVSSDQSESKLSSDEVFELTLKDAQSMIAAARNMVARVRELKKASDRELKDSRKTTKKSRKQGSASGPREPTGFAKPCLMKQALADFLAQNVAECKDLKASDLVTRTEVTKHLNKYVIANSLRDPQDNRRILYTKDSKLSSLITLPQGVTDLTYFNLQTAIKDLFEKAPEKVEAVSTA